MHRQLSDIPAGVVVNQVDSKTRLRPRKRRLETKTSRKDTTRAVVLKLWGVDEQASRTTALEGSRKMFVCEI